MAMIDQTTRGHQFLKMAFNYTPTVGWQACNMFAEFIWGQL